MGIISDVVIDRITENVIGKVSSFSKTPSANLRPLIKGKIGAAVALKAKPAGAKGTSIQRVAVSSTMGPGVKIDPREA